MQDLRTNMRFHQMEEPHHLAGYISPPKEHLARRASPNQHHQSPSCFEFNTPPQQEPLLYNHQAHDALSYSHFDLDSLAEVNPYQSLLRQDHQGHGSFAYSCFDSNLAYQPQQPLPLNLAAHELLSPCFEYGSALQPQQPPPVNLAAHTSWLNSYLRSSSPTQPQQNLRLFFNSYKSNTNSPAQPQLSLRELFQLHELLPDSGFGSDPTLQNQQYQGYPDTYEYFSRPGFLESDSVSHRQQSFESTSRTRSQQALPLNIQTHKSLSNLTQQRPFNSADQPSAMSPFRANPPPPSITASSVPLPALPKQQQQHPHPPPSTTQTQRSQRTAKPPGRLLEPFVCLMTTGCFHALAEDFPDLILTTQERECLTEAAQLLKILDQYLTEPEFAAFQEEILTVMNGLYEDMECSNTTQEARASLRAAVRGWRAVERDERTERHRVKAEAKKGEEIARPSSAVRHIPSHRSLTPPSPPGSEPEVGVAKEVALTRTGTAGALTFSSPRSSPSAFPARFAGLRKAKRNFTREGGMMVARLVEGGGKVGVDGASHTPPTFLQELKIEDGPMSEWCFQARVEGLLSAGSSQIPGLEGGVVDEENDGGW